ncbi:MAG: TetR family transcriptional regulator [Desertimonas sp.]
MTDRLTHADIVTAALGLLAEGGLPALAMRRIASELGVQQSALYWHFDNKQRLLAAVADRIVAPVEVSAELDDGATPVEALAARLRDELHRFPDGAELVATAFAFRLGARRPLQQFTDELRAGGLSPAVADVAASVLLHFVLGFVTDEQQHDQAAALGAISPSADDDEPASDDDRFGRGVQLIVTGAWAS